MAQFGRPSADTTVGSYTDQAAGTANIFTTIDEAVVNDADFIRSPLAPVNSVYVTKLSTIEDPLSSIGHIIRARLAKDVTGGAQIDATIQLRQGYVSEASLGTLIATLTQTNLTSAFTTFALTLSTGEADSITDYTSLYLRVLFNQI